jgi:Spy/CpxP family protein refolding chaperone
MDMHMEKPKDHKADFLAALDLSEEQRHQIKSLFEQSHDLMKDKRKSTFELQQSLRQLAMSADYSDDKANALIAEMTAMQSSQLKQRMDLDHQICNLLTDEQQLKLAELKKRPFH